MNQTSWIAQVGDKLKLTATITPSNATNQNIRWMTSKSNVVVLDNDGYVTAIGLGDTMIIAISEDGSKTAICNVLVTNNTGSNTTQQPGGDNTTVTPGGDTTQQPGGDNTTVTPGGDTAQQPGGNNTTVTPGSDNTSQQPGGNATTQQPAGTTQQPNNTSVIPVESIEAMEENVEITVGGTENISPIVLPYNATDKTVVYTCSDLSVATITENGVVVGLKPGVVQVTMTASGHSASCMVVVKPAKVTGLKKAKVSSNKIALKWKKQKGVSGYKVYMYNKKTKKYKLYKTVKTNKITVKKLKKGTAYKFKVKAYKKTSSGSITGAVSKTYSVKTKK